MAHLHGQKLGKELCRILGIPSENVTRITFVAAVGDAANVEIIRLVDGEEMKELYKFIERYQPVLQ